MAKIITLQHWQIGSLRDLQSSWLEKGKSYLILGLYFIKTFYGRNLWIILTSYRMFVPGKPFQPSLVFVGEARSLP